MKTHQIGFAIVDEYGHVYLAETLSPTAEGCKARDPRLKESWEKDAAHCGLNVAQVSIQYVEGWRFDNESKDITG